MRNEFDTGRGKDSAGDRTLSIIILVVDSTNPDRGRSNAISLSNVFGEVYFYDGSKRHRLLETFEEGDLPQTIHLLLLHDTDKAEWDRLNRHAKFIVRYTGGTNIPETTNEEIWIQRQIEHFSSLDINEAREIADWVQQCGDLPDEHIPLPNLLGGSIHEGALKVLSALQPFGLIWEASGKSEMREGLQEAASELSEHDFIGFEAEVVRRLIDAKSVWPPPKYRRLVTSLNLVLENSAVGSAITDWQKAGVSSPPNNLEDALTAISSANSSTEWNNRLMALRESLLSE